MSGICLVVTNKWRSRTRLLIVPNRGVVIRPLVGGRFFAADRYVANWLIGNGYCILLESKPEPPVPEPEPTIERQVYIDQNSNLQLVPPIDPALPEPEIPIEQVRLIDFFATAEPADINSTISAITIKKAQELRQVELLQWSDVVRILSDRAIESAIKWAQGLA